MEMTITGLHSGGICMNKNTQLENSNGPYRIGEHKFKQIQTH